MTPLIFAVCGYMVAVVVEYGLSLVVWQLAKETARPDCYFAFKTVKRIFNTKWLAMQIIQIAFCIGAVCVYLGV